MGFTTGFLGGITLTSLVLSISLSLHSRNRLAQSLLLKQQSLVLTSIAEPQPLAPPPTARIARTGLVETAKDKWNAELESNVRKVMAVDWAGVWNGVEERVSRMWGQGLQKSREELPSPGK
ncbi:hypothetical protein LTR28_008052 [Elasticomyces elasticus]|nr:hypothetical protein LTR28_008052 [Elasticomyces elasticus]